jgi:hypothetical protein
MRCRLHGLFPDSKGNAAVNVNIGGPVGESAEDTGIQISFVAPSGKWGNPDAERINGKPVGPVPVMGHWQGFVLVWGYIATSP